MEFSLRTCSIWGLVVVIHYERSGSYDVFKNGVKVEPLGFLEGGDDEGDGAVLKAKLREVDGSTDGCGENNYEGAGTNVLRFYVNGQEDCII
jgi:hypothetical protein